MDYFNTTDTYNITTKILWKYYSHLQVYRPAVPTQHYMTLQSLLWLWVSWESHKVCWCMELHGRKYKDREKRMGCQTRPPQQPEITRLDSGKNLLGLDCLKSGPGPGRPRSRYGWTWIQIISPGPAGEWTGPGPNLVLKNPFKTSQRTYFLDNYLQRYGQNNKNFQK